MGRYKGENHENLCVCVCVVLQIYIVYHRGAPNKAVNKNMCP